MTETEPLLSVRNLEKHYPVGGGLLSGPSGAVRAVDGISFDIARGETLGLVGESGCGKSTAANSIVRLEEPTGGQVLFNGGDRKGRTRNDDGTHPNDVTRFDRTEMKAFRREVGMIFQDPSSSFDPRMPVGDSIGEPLSVHGLDDRRRRRAIVEDLLGRVGLTAADYERYPHEFSGGQKQRLALARALVLNPELIVADEPVSALDMSIQADILGLLDRVQSEFGLSLLFISHDMSVVREICDRVAVMYLGEIVEVGPTESVFTSPKHPYTEALVSAIPTPDPRTANRGIELTGSVPDPADPPAGCRFHTRCHAVVQPPDLDVDRTTWRQLLDFRLAIEAGEVDAAAIEERARIEADGDGREGSTAAEQLRRTFDLPETVSDSAVEEDLAAAIGAVLDGEDGRAAERLRSTVRTPCERQHPESVDHGDGHESACIRHDPEVRTAREWQTEQ
ncbi:MAG: peptide/nickel transport system ATP-binding protein [Natronomonas sp.]|jgi:peptide/nickel transport system ATP-binding protein|uniref:ABC transporter ATP-binding protein n=1 Tax=Natronomonas sp. TaxID=2184060 RepID=UPI0039895706